MDTLKKARTITKHDAAAIRIEPVISDKQLDEFIATAWPVYQNDPNWVAPLIFEQKQRFSPQKNPFFEHARWQAWVARRGDKIVGRISAQIDQLATFLVKQAGLKRIEAKTVAITLIQRFESVACTYRIALGSRTEFWTWNSGILGTQYLILLKCTHGKISEGSFTRISTSYNPTRQPSSGCIFL